MKNFKSELILKLKPIGLSCSKIADGNFLPPFLLSPLPSPNGRRDISNSVILTLKRYLYERGDHESALPIFQFALEIARKRSEDKPDLLADVLMCLAALGLHTSTPQEVLEYSEEHLRIRQLVYDRSNGNASMQVQYDLAMGYATMAMAYIRNDRSEEAMEQSEIAIPMYRSFPMYRNWDTVAYFAVAHAGWALWSLRRYQEAEELLTEAVNADKIRNKGGSYG